MKDVTHFKMLYQLSQFSMVVYQITTKMSLNSNDVLFLTILWPCLGSAGQFFSSEWGLRLSFTHLPDAFADMAGIAGA